MARGKGPLDVPLCWCHLPLAPQWKDVNLARPPEGTTAMYSTLDGRFLYRIRERSGSVLVERARIVAGEFRPHLFYSQGDWHSTFPPHEDWEELACFPTWKGMQDSENPAFGCAESDMIRQVAREWGTTEDEVRTEIMAQEADKGWLGGD